MWYYRSNITIDSIQKYSNQMYHLVLVSKNAILNQLDLMTWCCDDSDKRSQQNDIIFIWYQKMHS